MNEHKIQRYIGVSIVANIQWLSGLTPPPPKSQTLFLYMSL